MIAASHSHAAGLMGFFLPGEFDDASPLVKSLVYDKTVTAHPEYLARVQREIVAAVKSVYAGPLTYADNQVEDAPDAVTWWDAVDYIGQDAYPTLTQVERPSVDDLQKGWTAFRDKLQRLSEKWDRPVILTEIGCRSILGGAQNPWDWQRQGPVDLEVQRNFYEAAFRAVAGRTWLRGLYWWQWSPDPEDGGPADSGYTPHGKPAEDVFRSWYLRIP